MGKFFVSTTAEAHHAVQTVLADLGLAAVAIGDNAWMVKCDDPLGGDFKLQSDLNGLPVVIGEVGRVWTNMPLSERVMSWLIGHFGPKL